MKFWFDTEFYEDGMSIGLISIGVVSEDGRTYYAETYDSPKLAMKSEWLRQNVEPHLQGGRAIKFRTEIGVDLLKFMGEKPEIWAYYADYDWVALCQIFGTMMDLPKGWPMYCRDVKQLADMMGVTELPAQYSQEHNALADAVWTAGAWRYLVGERHHAAA